MFFITPNQIVPARYLDPLRERFEVGALVAFEGIVRNQNNGKKVFKLEYECFESLAKKEGMRILGKAQDSFDIIDSISVHRFGMLNIKDIAVWVGVTAVHRKEAFKACEYIINEIKAQLPIWKKEYYENGDSGWVYCNECAVHSH